MSPSVSTTAMTVAAAVVGSKGVRTDTLWYQTLDKPAWQPPPVAFPLVWTPLYAMVAYGTGRLVEHSPPPERLRIWALTVADLVANAGWNWAFFDRRSPAAGLAVIAVLDGLNLGLLRAARRRDRKAAAALAPYVAWCGFATALNLSLWRRNR